MTLEKGATVEVVGSPTFQGMRGTVLEVLPRSTDNHVCVHLPDALPGWERLWFTEEELRPVEAAR